MNKVSEFSNVFRPQKRPLAAVPDAELHAPSAWKAFLPPDRFGMGRVAAQPLPAAGCGLSHGWPMAGKSLNQGR